MNTSAASAVTDAITEATTADPRIAALLFDVNQHWMIYAGSLVFFMQAGFSLLEAGSVSAKNSTNVLFKNLLVRVTIYNVGIVYSNSYFMFSHSIFYLQNSGRMHQRDLVLCLGLCLCLRRSQH